MRNPRISVYISFGSTPSGGTYLGYGVEAILLPPRPARAYVHGQFSRVSIVLKRFSIVQGKTVPHISRVTMQCSGAIHQLVGTINAIEDYRTAFGVCSGGLSLAGPAWLAFIRPNGSSEHAFEVGPGGLRWRTCRQWRTVAGGQWPALESGHAARPCTTRRQEQPCRRLQYEPFGTRQPRCATHTAVMNHRLHPLTPLFANIACGVFPEQDLRTDVVLAPERPAAAVLAFTGHHVVAADVDPAWVVKRCPPGDLIAPISPDFLTALAEHLGLHHGGHCLVLCAPALAGPPEAPLICLDLPPYHPRIARALHYRRDIRAYQMDDGNGSLTIGRGLGDRWEAGFQVDAAARNRGLGCALAVAARHLIAPGESVFMQVAVRNIASTRAILSAGFLPIGAEVLYT